MKSIKHYDDFTDVLNRMNNDDFALFLTGYAESIGRNIQLLPIHIDKFDCLAWVGYFTENGGLNGMNIVKRYKKEMALREYSLNAFYLPISIVINLLTPFVILYNVTPIEQELINFPLSS